MGLGLGLGLDLGLSWWEEALLIGPTHFSPLLLALLPGPFGLLFGLPMNSDTLQGRQKVEKKETKGSKKLPKWSPKSSGKVKKSKFLEEV